MRVPKILCETGEVSHEETAREVAWRQKALARIRPEGPLLLASRRDLATVYWLLAALASGRTFALASADSRPSELEAMRAAIGAKRFDDAEMEFAPSAGDTAASGVDFSALERARFVVFTSGTSAAPKAVVLPVAVVRAAARSHCDHLQLTETDVWLASLPLHHVGGSAIVMRAFFCGQDIAFSETGGTESLRMWMLSGQIAGISAVPTVVKRLLDSGIPDKIPEKFRFFLVGGARIPDAIWVQILASALRTRILPTYGASELGSQALTARISDAPETRRANLHPLPGVQARLYRDSELEISGPNLFAGYLKSGSLRQRSSSWYATGDIARISGLGGFDIVERKSDLVISGGVNISPAEVEAEFARITGCSECALVGIPDADWGEAGILVYATRDGAPLSQPTAVLESMRTNLSAKKIPKRLVHRPSLPTGENGKILRREIRLLLADH